jgi:hypothetical protein
MATTVTFKTDLANGYSATEEIGGRVESVVVPCIAEVTSPSSNPIGDVIEFMDNPANPTAGRPYLWGNPQFTPDNADISLYQRLRLACRTNFKSHGKQANGKVLVSMDLQYIRRCNDIGSNESSSEGLTSSGDVSLSSVKTSKTRRGARPEDAATNIELTYKGATKFGEIDVLEPRMNFTLRQDAITDNPHKIVDSMAGYVNDGVWRGFDAKSLLCTRVSYQLITIAYYYSEKAVYRFECEFEKSAGPTWDVEIVYRDTQGKVPSDVAWNTSRKLIEYYPTVNFESLFSVAP